MGKNPSEPKKSWQQSIKAPLVFSLVLGIVAGMVAMISSTGGSDKPLRVDIGLTAFGVAFIASLLVISVMTMASKENPNGMGSGSGVNRSSDHPEKKLDK